MEVSDFVIYLTALSFALTEYAKKNIKSVKIFMFRNRKLTRNFELFLNNTYFYSEIQT